MQFNIVKLTLEDYIYLFRRTICLDIVMTVLYCVLGGISFLTPIATGSAKSVLTPMSILSLVLLVLVLAFWVTDAILVAYLKNMVHSYEHEPSAPDCVITWLWVSVASSIVGILVYIVRIGLEILMLVSEMHMESESSDVSWTPWLVVIISFIYVAVKVLRVFAFASFRSWIRVHWDSESAAVQPGASTV